MVRPEAERPSRAQIGRGRQIEPGVEAREEEEDLGVLRSQSQAKLRFFFCASGGLERIILVMRKSFQYQNLHNRLSIVDPNFLPKMHIYRLLRSIALCLLPTWTCSYVWLPPHLTANSMPAVASSCHVTQACPSHVTTVTYPRMVAVQTFTTRGCHLTTSGGAVRWRGYLLWVWTYLNGHTREALKEY